MPTPAETIRAKRDGRALGAAQIEDFAQGLASGSWSDAQVGAMAMAILLKGMTRRETVALTRAMTATGAVLDWSRAALNGPIVDKHSTGGVGDKVSLMLAPIVAACGAVVPMISGRGLGHTGGTLDKLQSLAGYDIAPRASRLARVLREAGCAIVGASARLAPADRRLYAIRDVTATVESVPLITASILSKKLAAGLQYLVLDVKAGNGAFCSSQAAARELARELIEVAGLSGLPAAALVTDMHQVLGHSAGNALEMREAIEFLAGRAQEPRLREVTLALAARMLHLARLASDAAQARRQAEAALDSGRAAERFEAMVHGLGGPPNTLSARFAGLPRAPATSPVKARGAGFVAAMDTRAIGLVITGLGGGRLRGHEAIDHAVGLSQVLAIGSPVRGGDVLALVHARDQASAAAAAARLEQLITIAEQPVRAPRTVHWASPRG